MLFWTNPESSALQISSCSILFFFVNCPKKKKKKENVHLFFFFCSYLDGFWDSYLSNRPSKTKKTCGTFRDSCTGTCQCWLTRKNLLISVLCGHTMLSTGPGKGDGEIPFISHYIKPYRILWMAAILSYDCFWCSTLSSKMKHVNIIEYIKLFSNSKKQLIDKQRKMNFNLDQYISNRDTYSWTPQCWPTNRNFHSSALYGRRMPSKGLT